MRTGKLLSFSFRALVLLLLVPLLWVTIAERYNEGVIWAASKLLPEESSLKVIGSHILIDHPNQATTVSIEALTLHYGLVLLIVLVLAAVDIGMIARIGWLLGFTIGSYALHVIGVTLLARGVAWASGDISPEDSSIMVFSLFAIFWGLLPALVGGAWSYFYWLPRLSVEPERRSSPGGAPK